MSGPAELQAIIDEVRERELVIAGRPYRLRPLTDDDQREYYRRRGRAWNSPECAADLQTPDGLAAALSIVTGTSEPDARACVDAELNRIAELVRRAMGDHDPQPFIVQG